MTGYDQDWVDGLAAASGSEELARGPLRILYVITDTADGKAAFHLDLDGSGSVVGTAGRLPRGESADVTVTAKEERILPIWRGERSRDAGFMSGDLKVEGKYERWLDEVVAAFESDAWRAAWADAAG